MARFTKRRDDNEPQIIAALLAIGAVVYRVEAGMFPENFGVPDLLVGYRGRTVLIEVKNPDKSSHARSKKGSGVTENASGKLTPQQIKWWSTWIGGEAHVVMTPEQAIAVVRGVEIPPEVSPMVLTGGAVGLGPCGQVLSPDQADTLAGALHEQAGQARALDKRLPK